MTDGALSRRSLPYETKFHATWRHAAAINILITSEFLGGILLGIALGVGRLAGNVAEPILVTLYSIAKGVLYPLVLLCFGLGISAKIAFGVMHGLIPITLFSMNAIRQMKPSTCAPPRPCD